jgi:C1A family cysteine protease
MKTRRTTLGPKWFVGILLVLCLTFGLGQMAVAEELGDIPLDPEIYQRYLKTYPDELREALPSAYDARDEGIVTSAKDQGGCGSCWAFASVGAMESHLLKKWGYGPTDLSEQQQVSCNTSMGGCAGGSSSAIQYWQTKGPIPETCFPYTAVDTTPCSYACTEMVTRVTGWHTVPTTTTDFKTSCYNDGPSYWRYDVYTDFAYAGTGFWYDANPGDVYVNSPSSSRRGGHAVLIIGWSDSKGAFLCKNSWGTTTGPNGDGTFWIAYSGHSHNLGFGMANFDLINNPSPDCDHCFDDSYGFRWCLNVIDSTANAVFFSGTVDMGGGEVRKAVATYLKVNKGMRFSADAGTGVPFNYNLVASGGLRGPWINLSPTAGHGGVTVTKVPCSSAPEYGPEVEGPIPGF